MSITKIADPAFIQQLVSENHSLKSLNDKLVSLEWDQDSILKCVSEFNKIKNANRQAKGFIYLVVGGILGFISCVLAIVDPVPELHNWFLFGLTSIAVILACYGLYSIFE